MNMEEEDKEFEEKLERWEHLSEDELRDSIEHSEDMEGFQIMEFDNEWKSDETSGEADDIAEDEFYDDIIGNYDFFEDEEAMFDDDEWTSPAWDDPFIFPEDDEDSLE